MSIALFTQEALIEKTKKVQDEIGVFSQEEINARYDRGLKQFLEEIEYRQEGLEEAKQKVLENNK